jgi:hypothetical protein
MHYRNGREAKVGDRVVGRCFNTKGLVAGTLVSLTPGPDACSAKVGFVVLHTNLEGLVLLRAVAFQGTEQHGSAGPRAVAVYEEDYTECKNLLHADDVARDGVLLVPLAEPKPEVA